MKKKESAPRPDFKVKFPHTLTTRTPQGNPVVVNYRRVHVKGGRYDIEAEIISPKPKEKQ